MIASVSWMLVGLITVSMLKLKVSLLQMDKVLEGLLVPGDVFSEVEDLLHSLVVAAF